MRERPGACHTRATRQGAQGVTTVTHGQVDAGEQDRRSRRSADIPGDQTSKLVMRVRFPSSALMVPRLISRIFRLFSRCCYDARLGSRARCAPDRLESVSVLLALDFFASANCLPMPAAIFWSRYRITRGRAASSAVE